MNEPKRRGRPPKAKLLQIAEPCAECGQAEGHYDDCSVGMGVGAAAFHAADVKASVEIAAGLREVDNSAEIARRKAQGYALRVWNGQSPDVPRAEKIRRVKVALEGQNLPFEGVELP